MMAAMKTILMSAVMVLLALCTASCAGTRIELAERMGYAKREQLVDRVQDARDEQEKAKEQFASALDEFLALTGADGGDLEKVYRRLNREFERAENRADAVGKKIQSIERVAGALFEEWENELGEYQNAELQRASEKQLDDTRDRYGDLLAAMKRAESKMAPVLAAFNDQVLFLKHNLNARAIASLDQSVASLEREIAVLIQEMEASIAEANAFIEEMGQ